MTYLTKNQISEMAEAALTNYEMTCEWSRAFDAAAEYALDEFGIRPNSTAVALAVNLAKSGWEGIRANVQAQLS